MCRVMVAMSSQPSTIRVAFDGIKKKTVGIKICQLLYSYKNKSRLKQVYESETLKASILNQTTLKRLSLRYIRGQIRVQRPDIRI